MFLNTTEGEIASTLGTEPLPEYQHETVRHLVFSRLTTVRLTIQDLHKRRHAEPNDWSNPISTGRLNDVMAILTTRVTIK